LPRSREQVKDIDPDREAQLRRAIEDLYFGYRAFTEPPDAILAERGLGRAHHRILYFVCRAPGISVGELLSVLAISKQAANRPLRELEQQGLVSGAPDPADRRIRRLSATPEGTALEAALSGSQMQLLESAFRHCGAEAERHWRAVMAELQHSAE
jgi:DNA-binding MarR family transcriptional regulator